jgi:hypothetical protein
MVSMADDALSNQLNSLPTAGTEGPKIVTQHMDEELKSNFDSYWDEIDSKPSAGAEHLILNCW